jgi:DNA-binding NtrC family response regulator
MDNKLRALVIDDEARIRTIVSDILKEDDWHVSEADSAEAAFEMVRTGTWSLVLCDVLLGGADGYQVLRRFKEEAPQAQVVLMTGHGSAVGALDATAFGAYDYLLKPFGAEEILTLTRAIRQHLATRHEALREAQGSSEQTYTSDILMVGRSQTFIEVMKLVGRVAGTDLPVLVTGESGTGKELIASALHRRSKRAAAPFVAVNCGAVPADLIESELFGHVKGAFTSAHANRTGLWEQADGGTIFLDEITETTANFQVKLLRALQEGEIRRVGSNQTKRVDVRVIAASNRDVRQEIEDGHFRQDLFFRLNGVGIHLPPLRNRREDIFPLANSFAARVWKLNPQATFSTEVLGLLERYEWPGNIRELENAVVRAVALCGGQVRAEDLPKSKPPTSGAHSIERKTISKPPPRFCRSIEKPLTGW